MAERQRANEEEATKAIAKAEHQGVKEEKATTKVIAKRDAANTDQPGDNPDEFSKNPPTLVEVIEFLADELHLERPSPGTTITLKHVASGTISPLFLLQLSGRALSSLR